LAGTDRASHRLGESFERCRRNTVRRERERESSAWSQFTPPQAASVLMGPSSAVAAMEARRASLLRHLRGRRCLRETAAGLGPACVLVEI
jgi:hypothetical protein